MAAKKIRQLLKRDDLIKHSGSAEWILISAVKIVGDDIEVAGMGNPEGAEPAELFFSDFLREDDPVEVIRASAASVSAAIASILCASMAGVSVPRSWSMA
jgi:hypothetical protein